MDLLSSAFRSVSYSVNKSVEKFNREELPELSSETKKTSSILSSIPSITEIKSTTETIVENQKILLGKAYEVVKASPVGEITKDLTAGNYNEANNKAKELVKNNIDSVPDGYSKAIALYYAGDKTEAVEIFKNATIRSVPTIAYSLGGPIASILAKSITTTAINSPTNDSALNNSNTTYSQTVNSNSQKIDPVIKETIERELVSKL